MKWINRNDDESNYEDRRGMSTGRKVAMGGGIGTIIMLALYLPDRIFRHCSKFSTVEVPPRPKQPWIRPERRKMKI